MDKARFRQKLAVLLVLLANTNVTGLFAQDSPKPANRPDPSNDAAKIALDSNQQRKLQEDAANRLRLPLEVTNSIGMEFVLIPAGEFEMGSPESQVDRHPDEFPHRVRIRRPFYLGTCEVTQAQYQEILGNNPSYFSASGSGRSRVQDKDAGSLPVESVSWENAIDFCTTFSAREEESKARRKYMLPTETQWEYACRSGTQTRYCCGDDKQALREIAWFAENSSQTTHPVGTRQANAWGLFDMYGNVREWCQDWYGEDYYRMSPADDPPGPPTGRFRAFRGGCYTLSAYHCRSSNRFGPYSLSSSFMGFRVAFAVGD